MSRPILKLGHRVPNRNHPLNQGKVAWLLSPNGEASYVPDLIGTADVRFGATSGLRVGGPVKNNFIGPAYRITGGALQSGSGLSPLISNLNKGPFGFSLAFWVMGFASNTHILSKGTRDVNSTGTGFYCGIDGSTRITFDIGSNNSMTYRTPTISLSRWYHCIWTWRNRNNCAGYLDGIAQSLSSLLVGSAFNAEGLTRLNLLTRSDGTNAGNIWLYDVQLWNYCLSAAQARQVFEETNAGYPNALLTIPDDGQESLGDIEKSVTSTLVLTQSIYRTIDAEVTSTLTLTQDIAVEQEADEQLEQTLDLDQTVDLNIVSNQEVESTLVLTQDIVGIKNLEFEVESTINFSHTIGLNIESYQTVEHTLTLDQQVDVIWEVISELEYTQDVTFQIFKYQSVTSTLTFTQDAAATLELERLVISTLNPYHFVLVNKVLNLAVTSTLLFSSTQSGNASKSVSNTLTFTQTIDVVLAKRVTSTLINTQSIARNIVTNRTILQNPGLFQTVARNIIANRPVTSTLNLTQTIVVHKVKEVAQTLNLTQTIDVIASKIVTSELEFTETITYNQIRNLDLFQLCFFTQTITVEKVLNRDVVPSVLAFDQFITVHKTYNIEVESTLNLSHEIVFERFFEEIEQELEITQEIEVARIITLTVNQTLSLTQTVTLQKTLARTVTSNLIFLPYSTKFLNGIEIQVPNIVVGKSQRFTLLKSRHRAITLPNPIFGDAEANTGVFTLRRGMRGKAYTYVKTTDFRKLSYTFHIPRIKAYELIDFVSESNSEIVDVENWKGEIWRTLISLNPTDFMSVERYASQKQFDDQREKVEVRMEFEGFRLV